MSDKNNPNILYNISISDDKHHAFITLGYVRDSGGALTEQSLTDSLAKAGVINGIDKNKLTVLLNSPCNNRQEIIATGSSPEDGTNARLEYLFPVTSDSKPKVLANGAVDFKELGLIKNVREGEPLCVKTAATPGIPGMNVKGEIIPAQAGRDFMLPVGQNTFISEDGLTLLSKINGQVDLVNGRVNVMKQYEIKEDVDYNTGNINFVGNISIGGDVCAGFSVRSEGNVFIKGSIDGGTVEANGNITVVNGIKSQPDTKVTCGGDLHCKFLQNANVDVDGNLETASCINSVIRVGNTARFHGSQAMILGSRVTAGKLVETQNIGSKSSKVVSVVEVGINPRIAERAAKIPAETKDHEKKVESVKRLISLFKQLEAVNRLTEDKKEELAKLMTTMQLSEQAIMNLNREKEEIEEKMQSLGYGTIKIFGTAYAGTQIHIGSEKKILADDYQFTQFVRTHDGISISPAQR